MADTQARVKELIMNQMLNLEDYQHLVGQTLHSPWLVLDRSLT